MPSSISLVDQIDKLLPQTQCTKCGYEGCRPYAQALAAGDESINRCPPGGQAGIEALAALLNKVVLPLNTDCGPHTAPMVAVIDEAYCIGCTLCIQACPVDAIIGAGKLMHTVAPDLCTGCDLCVSPCPVDCISMVPAGREWTPRLADAARTQHRQRQQRLDAQHAETSKLASRTLANKAPVAISALGDASTRRHVIADALARARERRRNQAAAQLISEPVLPRPQP